MRLTAFFKIYQILKLKFLKFNKFCKFCDICKFFAEISRKLLNFQTNLLLHFEIGAVQKCAHLVELEKCCQTHIFLQISLWYSRERARQTFSKIYKKTLIIILLSLPAAWQPAPDIPRGPPDLKKQLCWHHTSSAEIVLMHLLTENRKAGVRQKVFGRQAHQRSDRNLNSLRVRFAPRCEVSAHLCLS